MPDTTNRIAGTAYVTVNGISYLLRGELAYNPGIVSRESVVGMDGGHGYIEKPISPWISGTFSDAGGLRVADLNGMSNVTVTVELANGKLIIGRNMWTVESQESKAAEGTIEVRWEGLQGAVTEN